MKVIWRYPCSVCEQSMLNCMCVEIVNKTVFLDESIEEIDESEKMEIESVFDCQD